VGTAATAPRGTAPVASPGSSPVMGTVLDLHGADARTARTYQRSHRNSGDRALWDTRGGSG